MNDGIILKASFRECPISDRKQFAESRCIIPISVGQSVHEGKKFLSAMKLINASFRACTILVDDSVQRHTMAIDNPASADELYRLAVKEGSEWLKRNESSFKNLTIPYNIMRWDDWLTVDKYKASHMQVKKYYEESVLYRNAIHTNIDSFLSRYLGRISDNSHIDYNRTFSLCLDYLLEECAVMCLWVDNKFEFEVYPSGRNEAMAATYEYLIKPVHPDLLKPVALRFKKYPGIPTL
jgi:hypothetical protein